MNDNKPNTSFDGREELILMIIAFVTPLAVLPVLLGL
jgi:hypothetical protein